MWVNRLTVSKGQFNYLARTRGHQAGLAQLNRSAAILSGDGRGMAVQNAIDERLVLGSIGP
jgi:hypothetical protein